MLAMVKINLTLILCTLLFRNTSVSNDEICSSVTNDTNNVEWPSTSSKTLSKPPCSGKNKELVYRDCTNGIWGPEPACVSKQREKLPSCPSNYTELGSICYAFSSESTFPPKCPSKDVLPFETYQYLIPANNIVPFWMPVRRDFSNGVGLMRWTEASSKYNTEFTKKIHSGLARGHNCIIYHSEDYIEAVSCNEVHPGVCAYKKFEAAIDNDICEEQGKCVQNNFFDRTRCTCLGNGPMRKTLAEFLNVEQNTLYSFLTTENCSMGLMKHNNTYIWSHSKKEIEYTFWSKDVTFDEDHIYGASTKDGWILTQNLLSCFLYEVKITEKVPTLQLTYSNGAFMLYITNYRMLKTVDNEVLILCFTNADSSELVSQITKTKKQVFGNQLAVIEFDKISDAPGLYWCKGFGIDLEAIRSEYFVEIPDDSLEFVSLFIISDLDDETVTDSTLLYIRTNMLLIFEEDPAMENITARVMKLKYSDANISVNIHFTVKTTSEEEEESYNKLQDLLNFLFAEAEGFKFLRILSASFCFAEYGTKLNWSKTPIGENSTSEEFCMTVDGHHVSRRCEGNFIDGAQWSSYDDCIIFQPSNISYQLLHLFDDTADQLTSDLQAITNYRKFTPLDVNLLAELYSVRFDSFNSVPALVNSINELINNDRKILETAQREMKATDKLLTVLYNTMVSHKKSYDISLNKFAYISLEGVNGIMILEDNSLKKITNGYTFSEIIKADDIKSVIWLDPELPSMNEATVSVFYDDSFFQEMVPTNRNTSIIFGLAFSNSSQKFPKPVTVLYKIDSNYDEDENCVIWNQMISNRGLWMQKGIKQNVSKFILCKYYQSGYFTLTYTSTTDTNVTDDLLNVLGGSDPTYPQLLTTLYHISKKYDKFEWGDVKYVGKIFEMVTYQEKINLKDLTKTVSNLHNIKRDVLIESQKRDKSTDFILTYIDEIIRKNQNQIMIKDERFMILIVNLGKMSFDGIAILNDKDSFETEILNDHVSLAQVIKYDNFDSVLYLNPKLKKQINDSTIIITIFDNDALFNEISNHSKEVGKIFGVILPDIGKYLGPVTILHKVDTSSNYGQCVHWNYSTSTNVSSFWKEENNSDSSHYGLVQCDFWHTTHFALLLLERDGNTSTLQFESLNVITTTTTVISLVSLNCVVLTAIFFKKWRRNTGNQILLNFTIIVMVQLILFYISGSINRHPKNYFLCTVMGILLHYSTISQFYWMLVVAVLQYWRYVLVLRGPPNNVLLKSCLCGWVLPLVPVASVFFADQDNYISGAVGLCYPSEWGLYLGVWFPVGSVITVNCIIFIIILYNITCRRKKFTEVDRKEMLYQWRLGVLLFFILGLTWVFGFVANFHHDTIFVYLFCTTATLEGFVIFVFFIVCNPDTRYLYWRAVKKYSFSQNK